MQFIYNIIIMKVAIEGCLAAMYVNTPKTIMKSKIRFLLEQHNVAMVRWHTMVRQANF